MIEKILLSRKECYCTSSDVNRHPLSPCPQKGLVTNMWKSANLMLSNIVHAHYSFEIEIIIEIV